MLYIYILKFLGSGEDISSVFMGFGGAKTGINSLLHRIYDNLISDAKFD